MPLSVKNFLIAEEVKKLPQARQENPSSFRQDWKISRQRAKGYTARYLARQDQKYAKIAEELPLFISSITKATFLTSSPS